MSKHKDGANHKTGHRKDKRERRGARNAMFAATDTPETPWYMRGDYIEPDYPFRRIPAKH